MKILAKIQELEVRLATETGPRGGKIVGKTESGKNIYESKSADKYPNFTSDDHFDATKMHQFLADHHEENRNSKKKKHHQNLADHHLEMSRSKHLAAELRIAADNDVYIGWYEVVSNYIYVYAALWTQAASVKDLEKAKAHVKKEYGDKGLATFIPGHQPIHAAKKLVIEMMTKKAKTEHPGLHIKVGT